MRYLCMVCYEQKTLDNLSRSEFDALVVEALAYDDGLRKGDITSTRAHCNRFKRQRRFAPSQARYSSPMEHLAWRSFRLWRVWRDIEPREAGSSLVLDAHCFQVRSAAVNRPNSRFEERAIFPILGSILHRL